MSGVASLNIESSDKHERKTLGVSLMAAFFIEVLFLTAIGWKSHWLAHPVVSDHTDNYIEAQIFELPPEAQLTEKKASSAPAKSEATLSKVSGKGREAKPDENKIQEENQTQSGQQLAPTHGPIAIFSPAPKIPSYLQTKELHASVIIDFFVSAQGNTSPRLVGSSGNEELDAIALDATKKWQFRPAEKDHQAIDSKVRLRIVFEVQ